VIEIGSIYTNTSCSITIPPLTVELSALNITKMHTEWSYVESNIKLLISNTWILPISTDWIKLYLEDEPLSTFHYFVPYEEIALGKSMVADVEIKFDMNELYEVLVLHEYLRVCIGLSCLDLPLTEFTHKIGEEIALDNLVLKINNISVVDVIGVQQYSYWEEKTVIDCYKAPEGYGILVAYIEVRNRGLRSIDIEYIDFDDSVAITKGAVFELTYLSKLSHIKNVNPAVAIEAKRLWENVKLELKPNESSEMVLLFLVPRDTVIHYIVVDISSFIVIFAV